METVVLIILRPFNIFLELVTIKINENTMATSSTHCSFAESMNLVQTVPTMTPKNKGMEINKVLDQRMSLER